MTLIRLLSATLLFLSFWNSALAGPGDFTTGPLIKSEGPNAPVEQTYLIPEGAVFKHSFDTSEVAKPGELNRTLVSAARFLNMHSRAGVPEENMSLAVIIHGKAVFDVADHESYRVHHDLGEEAVNPNIALIMQLESKGVQIIVCGQSAAYYDVATADLAPSVDMALSAMTAHALLQQQGYTVNPF